ncbi:MAG TPA: dienelactone hydrolase family protein [Opitutaceae bacterium]
MTAALAISLTASAGASIVTRSVDYEQGGVKLKGFLAYDDARAKEAKLPGVLVVPEWWGLNAYAKHRAEQLAGMGYVAFGVDMYGDGKVATDPDEAGKLAGQFYGKPLMAERAQAALDQLLATGLVDPSRVAAIGYCFGGSTVQALAYSGAPLAGIVSFHGGLIPITQGGASRIKARMLICHGALDPGTSPEKLSAFLKAANEAKVDYKFDIYAGAYHAFTNPDSDKTAEKYPKMRGFIAYSPSADRRSWQDMQDFFAEIFGGKG